MGDYLMKQLNTLFLCLSCNLMGTWAEDAQKDLKFLKETIVENHPGIYNELDPEFTHRLDQHYESAAMKAEHAQSLEDYAQIMQDFARSFNDTHVDIRITGVARQNVSIHATDTLYASELLPDMLYVKIPTFEPTKEQQLQLEKIINKAPQWRNKKLLIFDVRGNGGGNSAWGTKLVKSLFSETFAPEKLQEVSGKTFVEWRCSQANIDHMQTYINQFKEQFGEDSKEHAWALTTVQDMQKAHDANKKYFTSTATNYKSTRILEHPVTATIIVLIDRRCGSACLDFIDYLKAMDYPILLMGETTKADSLYMEVRVVDLPSGQGKFCFPIKVYRNRVRGHNEPYLPDIFL